MSLSEAGIALSQLYISFVRSAIYCLSGCTETSNVDVFGRGRERETETAIGYNVKTNSIFRRYEMKFHFPSAKHIFPCSLLSPMLRVVLSVPCLPHTKLVVL